MGLKITDLSRDFSSRNRGNANMGTRLVDRLGITNTTIRNACATLYTQLSAEGIWVKADLTVLPFVGGTADTHRASMKSENQNLFFANSLSTQHTSLGYNPLATLNSYALSDFTLPVGSATFWMAGYNTSIPVSGAGIFAAARLNDANNNSSFFMQRGNASNARTLGRYSQYATEVSAQTATSYAIKKGLLGFQRVSLSSSALYDDGLPIVVDETAIGQPVVAENQRLALMSGKSNSSYTPPANFSLGFFAAGTIPLTDAQWVKLNTIVKTFETSLGRA